ncbi:MAG TPA: DEAD/DEAH box helicase family protein, partial [Victivallales bacterium]|nr:DEAD/DEAH box helicase family protein [Victivallales bacterium]
MIKIPEIAEIENGSDDILLLTKDFFGDKSPLQRSDIQGAPKYEDRPQQKAMAIKIAEAFDKKENLCVEAPTGIGKSYAYLVPSVFYAKESGLPVLISTETINLQEQLMQKDIPVLEKMIEGGFSAVLAKGRSHYVCLRRMHFAEERVKEELFEDYVLDSMRKIMRWIAEGGSAEDSDISFQFERKAWEMLCCEAGNCFGPKCKHYRECFYWRARRNWDKADIVVANHALFFTSMKVADIYEYSLLPEYGAIVFDEAHTIENEAAEHGGIRLSKFGFEMFLKKLYDPDKAKGIFLKGGVLEMELRGLVGKILKLSSAYFKTISSILIEKNVDSFRFRERGFVNDLLSEELFSLSKLIGNIIENDNDEDSRQEKSSYAMKIDAYADSFHKFSNMELEDYVYWAESYDGRDDKVELFASPVNVEEILRKNIFLDGRPTILTSATLSVENSLDYYSGRVGYERGEKIILGTVFDYEKQMSIFISKSVPQPEDENYITALSQEIRKYTEKTHGKAFVLFTNYEHMRNCAEELRSFFSEKGINLLVHGEGHSRNKMIDHFRRDIDSVIFG